MLTKRLRQIPNARHFRFALNLVFTEQCLKSGGLRCSLLNAALVLDGHQRVKIRCLLVSFPRFTPGQMCLSRSFRWHYMSCVHVDFTVYGF